jgi:histone H3/H4
MPKPTITKPNTVETFIKANSSLRVAVDAVSCLFDQLNTLSTAIVKAAETNAKQEGRTTIMSPDIKAAMTTVTGSTSDLPFLFKQLETLTAKDTATLSDLIQKWIDTH